MAFSVLKNIEFNKIEAKINVEKGKYIFKLGKLTVILIFKNSFFVGSQICPAP